MKISLHKRSQIIFTQGQRSQHTFLVLLGALSLYDAVIDAKETYKFQNESMMMTELRDGRGNDSDSSIASVDLENQVIDQTLEFIRDK